MNGLKVHTNHAFIFKKKNKVAKIQGSEQEKVEFDVAYEWKQVVLNYRWNLKENLKELLRKSTHQ